MSYEVIIEHLKLLNTQNPSDYNGDLNELLDKNIQSTLNQLQKTESIFDLYELHRYKVNENLIVWNYLCLSSYLFKELGEVLKNDDSILLSVHQNKSLQKAFYNYVNIGLCSNLLPNMCTYRKIPNLQDNNILNQYKILAGTTTFLIFCLNYPKLRLNIMSNFSKPLLSALYQIIYCPLKQPTSQSTCNLSEFVMTQEIYDFLIADKEKFKNSFDYVVSLFNRKVYVHDTMMLITPKSPKWLKLAVSRTLDKILFASDGIRLTLWAMLEDKVDSFESNDRTKTWDTLEILSKLILNNWNKSEFNSLCNQLQDLLNKREENNKNFEDLFCLCLKKLYLIDKNTCEEKLLVFIFDKLDWFCNKNKKFVDNEEITFDVELIFRLLYNCFIGKNLQTTDLPIHLLKKYLNVFFNLYVITLDSSHNMLKNQIEDILLKYLKNSDSKIFDNFLFDFKLDEIILIRQDIFIEFRGNNIFVKIPQNKIKTNIGKKADCLLKLTRKNENLYISLFLFYLKILQDKEKYFKSTTNPDLLKLEDELTFDEITERKLMVYQNLSALSEDILIQEYINEKPNEIIEFLKESLLNLLQTKIHKSMNYESDDFQNAFTIIMILQALVMNSTKENLKHYRTLSEIVHTLFCETINLELKQLLKTIDGILSDDKFKPKIKKVEVKSEVDKALEDVCDPLLPVRGHGLLVLTKLVEKKDEEIMERKNYVLNVFQQKLKDDDSFIYLNAIGGLAAMGDVFPDIVIKILTEEYSDFTKKDEEDGSEIRMKLGEILVRVTKVLGEMAPKYKSLLLNTFLVGTKDEDHLIRASSLSNLGEICKVLGYKLGSIVTEVLVCVHAIITTDKSIEARRAAVMVIRQLLSGLEAETVVFLKDHILEIYRTLKTIYQNDKDDIMRLQAQLALEELNENVKKFIFPKPTLHMEKKIIMLN